MAFFGRSGNRYCSNKPHHILFYSFFLFTLFISILSQVGCSSPVASPTQLPAKTLPPTWTKQPTLAISDTPTITSTLTPSVTPVPKHNWWAISLAPDQNLRVKYAAETSQGGVLFWAQERDQNNQIIRDHFTYLQKNGFPVWEKIISPEDARIHYVQLQEDGTLLFFGYQQENDQQNSFYIHLSESGEVLDSNIFRGSIGEINRVYLNMHPQLTSAHFGRVMVKGEIPGTNYVTSFRNYSDGGMTVMGPIHGPITSDGATFSYLRGLWAVRFNGNNIVIWQRFFQTQPTGPFFDGVVLPDGSILITSEQEDYLSILKLNPDGYPIFWKYYSSIVAVQSLSGSSDGAAIITSSKEIVKLDSDGEVDWSKEFVFEDDNSWLQYAFETKNGDLLVFMDTESDGLVVARLNMEEPFAECAITKFSELPLFEHSPYLPNNLSGSVRVTPSTYDLFDSTSVIGLDDSVIEVKQICRYTEE